MEAMFSVTRHVYRTCLFVLAILAVASISNMAMPPSSASAAVCGSEPTSTTGRSTQQITVPASTTYTIWSRIKAPDANPVEYAVYVDGQCFTIGQSAQTPDTLTWVDYENGSSIDKATVSLSAGSHTLVLTAGTEDLELDRVMLLSDSCVPTGTGDNCLNDTTLPVTSITSPTDASTISDTTSITANATDNDAIDYVEFYRDGSTLLGTDNSAPYSYNWDTSTVSDGPFALTVRAYDLSGNVETSAVVNVTVNNATPVNATISSFTATPSTIIEGQSSTLDWTVSAGENCSIDQSIGSVAQTGSQVVTPTLSTAYALTCQGLNGGASDTETVTVTVNPSPVNANITTFTASPISITDAPGQSSTLNWSVAAGSGCSINQGIGAVGLTGTRDVSPSSTTTYTLSCNGQYGGAADSEQITVTVAPAPDTDGDNVKDHIEVAAPNSGDANHDGTADSQQASVTSFINVRTGRYNTLVSAGDCDVLGDVSSANGKATYQMGVTSFTLECVSAGQGAQVELLLDQEYDVSLWDIMKVNSGLTIETNISRDVTISSVNIGGESRTRLAYALVDGGELDEDGVANGTIVDPLAITSNTPLIGAPNAGTGNRINIAGAIVIVFASGIVSLGTAGVWYFRNISRAISAHGRK